MATPTSPPLPYLYPGYLPYAHRPAKYRLYDLPKPDVYYDERHRHPSQVEADAGRSSRPNMAETGLQLDVPAPGPSYHSPESHAPALPVVPTPHASPRPGELPRFLRNTPTGSRFPIVPMPPLRPIRPFTSDVGSSATVVMERPQSVSSTVSSAVSELGPAHPGGESEKKDSARELRERGFRDLVTSDFCCTQCRTYIPSPRTEDHASGTLLHLFCPCCPAVYCRGCKNPVNCDRTCNARHKCAIKRCCSEVRALAIFEFLSAFDQFYLDASATFHKINGETTLKASQRRAFLDHVLLYADQYSSHEDAYQFFSRLKRTVKNVYFWLLPEEDSNIVDPRVGPMLAVSFLPEVLYEFVKQIYWVRKIRPPRLENLLQMIKKLLNTLAVRRDEDLIRVVHSPFSMIDESRGLGAWLWDDDDTCTWSSYNSSSQTLAEWIPFLDNFLL